MWKNFTKPDKEELKKSLDPMTFAVTQEDATERPHSSPLDTHFEEGIYVDAVSGEPLFSSRDKYDAGCGWPSFTKPIVHDVVTAHRDRKLGALRTEIRSATANSHLGHVFNDGPQEKTGLRYCLNGAALRFVPKADMIKEGYSDYLQYV